MARQKIVAGNWKMNLDLSSAVTLAEEIAAKAPEDNVLKILFPPFPFLSAMKAIKGSQVRYGAQNCSDKDKGAYTGEVSAAMIKSCGAEFCIVGHSERRQYFHEASVQLTEKIKRCLENSLTPVFCIGEKLEERRSGKHFVVVEQQLKEVLGNFSAAEAGKMVLAYEPVWAIGTGETATPAQAQEMHAFIRKTCGLLYGRNVSDAISILYGGSCNAQNARELFACEDVDGGLIGGASLKADDFVTIMKSFPVEKNA